MNSILLEQVEKVIVKDVPKPVINDNEVLIKAEFLGICGSDMHVYKGKHAFRKPPVVLGHEIAGIVLETGKSVKSVKAGDRVTIMPAISCGKCKLCASGNSNLCGGKTVPGTANWIGAFVEFFNAPESTVFRLPDSLSTCTGVLAEPLAVAIHILKKIKPEDRKNLLILGAGAIGMLTLLAAKNMGFKKIVITDVVDYNLEKASENGADMAINVSRDPLEKASAEFGGEKADAVVISAGAPDILDQAIENVKTLGTIVYVAMIVNPLTASTYPVVFKELSIFGSMIYTEKDFRDAISMLASSPAAFEKLVTHKFDFSRAADAFEMMDKHTEGFIKVLLKV
jgi:L-iditol 2-dehydrogenase